MDSLKSTPLVTIIIPSYNHDKFLRTLIDSVCNQTYKNLQIVILDDGSKDQSPDILQELTVKYGFTLILKKNEGLCATLNQGLDLAKGKYVVVFGSDDIMPANRIEEQVSLMESDPTIDVISGAVRYMSNDGQELSLAIPKKLGTLDFESMMFSNYIFAPSAMIKKDVFDRFGKYNSNYVIEDYYLWMKILSNGGKIVNTNHLWALYRFDPKDFKKRYEYYYKGIVQVLSDYREKPMFHQAMARVEWAFLLKVCLLNPHEFNAQFKSKTYELSFLKTFMLWILFFAPQFVKNAIVTFKLFR